ncbi:hypothetical protein CGCA056_v000146 [Colletotrichum aenigma]|uniref:uncharacterized protein n=1 Tax=Colletotrichum aenigma TaxID=1215731 RepID=UPI001872339A|nr:uncharacterized protein CGCA056_v000146 [Colletotrichum aenigma]KAF5528579.1 hypothetical protein CGCA056_v000146 [Colletotrichum aenigma]
MALTAKELVTTWENALSIYRRTSPATYPVGIANNQYPGRKYKTSFGKPFSLNRIILKAGRNSPCDPSTISVSNDTPMQLAREIQHRSCAQVTTLPLQ